MVPWRSTRHAVANADDFAWALLTLAAPRRAIRNRLYQRWPCFCDDRQSCPVDRRFGGCAWRSQALAELLIGTVSSGAAVAQIANGDAAKVSLTNSGVLSLLARAGATATGFATASVDIGAAIAQAALGVANADASMVNQGSIVVDAEAIAKGGTNALPSLMSGTGRVRSPRPQARLLPKARPFPMPGLFKLLAMHRPARQARPARPPPSRASPNQSLARIPKEQRSMTAKLILPPWRLPPAARPLPMQARPTASSSN